MGGAMEELTRSYYEASAERPPPRPPLDGDIAVDVCVVGGGFTGLSCALELARAGKSVALLEAARLGWGASGRNGGQVLRGYSTDNLAAPAKAAGVGEKELFDMSMEAVHLVRDRIRQFNIACDWQDGSMLAAIHPRHCRELESMAGELARWNHPVQLLDAAETREHIASRRYCGAMTDDRCGHFHPLKYLLGLARAAADAGVKIYENTAAQSFSETESGAIVRAGKFNIRCEHLALAGNAYLDIDRQLRARIMPVSTYIGATAPMTRDDADNLILERRAVCDMNFVLDYFRVSADHRLLFGGRVSYANREPRDLEKVIRQRMRKVFPQIGDAVFDYVWGGSVAITVNRFPDIGRHGRRAYYAQGFSGHGAALSGFAGKVMADAMLGDSGRLDVFARVRHADFVGGRFLRAPLLVAGMMYYRLRDLVG